jgi:Alternate to MurJ
VTPPSADHIVTIVTKSIERIDLTPHLWSWKVIGGMAITFVVQGVTIGAYAARLAGVQTGRIATSISLFNLFMTAGRLANLFSALMVGPLSDGAGKAVRLLQEANDGAGVATFQHNFDLQLRLIVLAGTAGMIGFALCLPLFTYLFRRGIRSFEQRGSLPHSLVQLVRPGVFGEVLAAQRLPSLSRVLAFNWRALPKRMLIFNVVVTAVYAIGVQASYYASILDVDAARTALGLSGIINGIGTIAFTLFVDPTSSMITDQAIHGKRSIDDVKCMVFYLALTAIAGTLVSQAIFYPSAVAIEEVARFFNHVRG